MKILLFIVAILILAAGFYLDHAKKSSSSSTPSLKSISNSGNSLDQKNGRGSGGSPAGSQASQSNNEGESAKTELKDYGPAPEFAGIARWLNSDPLAIQNLRGRVVLIDFWTYSCINCIRTLPYVASWHEKYKQHGLVIIGVHTPEFAFEKDVENVKTAIQRHKIAYPVAQDNDFSTWNAYNNRYWPAHYLINKSGQIVYTHFGEGNYDKTESAIQQAFGIGVHAAAPAAEQPATVQSERDIRTPEIYFGLDRIELLDNSQKAATKVSAYQMLQRPPEQNHFALEGSWSFDRERARLERGSGKITLSFHARDVHMVAKSSHPVSVEVIVDGKTVRTIEVMESKLYTLFESEQSGSSLLELRIDKPGFQIFTFTFG